jgi:hypothetical protein
MLKVTRAAFAAKKRMKQSVGGKGGTSLAANRLYVVEHKRANTNNSSNTSTDVSVDV